MTMKYGYRRELQISNNLCSFFKIQMQTSINVKDIKDTILKCIQFIFVTLNSRTNELTLKSYIPIKTAHLVLKIICSSCLPKGIGFCFFHIKIAGTDTKFSILNINSHARTINLLCDNELFILMLVQDFWHSLYSHFISLMQPIREITFTFSGQLSWNVDLILLNLQ